MNSRFTAFSFLFFIFISSYLGYVPAAVVTLLSVQLHKTHELLGKPTVYFQCQGENKTILPDLKEANVVYTFKGEESWQPLIEFPSKKCKRCGLYEKDILVHDVFDEWEFCPSDFAVPNGLYTHVKEKEFNASFSCPECADLVTGPHDAAPESGRKGMSVGIVILISAVVTIIVVMGFIGGYKYWKKRKRQQEQARFLKLFEEQDFEDELGLGDDL